MSDNQQKALYGIQENRNWFSRFFKCKRKRYTLYREKIVRVHCDSWLYTDERIKEVIEHSNDIEYLHTRLDTLCG